MSMHFFFYRCSFGREPSHPIKAAEGKHKCEKIKNVYMHIRMMMMILLVQSEFVTGIMCYNSFKLQKELTKKKRLRFAALLLLELSITE